MTPFTFKPARAWFQSLKHVDAAGIDALEAATSHRSKQPVLKASQDESKATLTAQWAAAARLSNDPNLERDSDETQLLRRALFEHEATNELGVDFQQLVDALHAYNHGERNDDGRQYAAPKCQPIWANANAWRKMCGPDPHKTVGCQGGAPAKPREQWSTCCFDRTTDCADPDTAATPSASEAAQTIERDFDVVWKNGCVAASVIANPAYFIRSSSSSSSSNPPSRAAATAPFEDKNYTVYVDGDVATLVDPLAPAGKRCACSKGRWKCDEENPLNHPCNLVKCAAGTTCVVKEVPCKGKLAAGDAGCCSVESKPSEIECGRSGCHCCAKDGEAGAWILGNSGPNLTANAACAAHGGRPSSAGTMQQAVCAPNEGGGSIYSTKPPTYATKTQRPPTYATKTPRPPTYATKTRSVPTKPPLVDDDSTHQGNQQLLKAAVSEAGSNNGYADESSSAYAPSASACALVISVTMAALAN